MRRAVALIVAAMALLGLPTEGAASTHTFSVGFFDGQFGAPGLGPVKLSTAKALGAETVRIDIGWPAATRPSQPTDPRDPAYDFASADAAVRAATARGLRVLVAFTGAPAWAEGRGRPAAAPLGAWKPDPAAIGAYGRALARRYSGRFPDPSAPGRSLPRVRYFQVWNEPNIDKYLAPQWEGSSPAGPLRYRAMLDAFFAGVKGVQPSAVVVTAGTGPYGDFGHGRRTMPVPFWRTVLARRVRFDVLAHHPYSVRSPTGPATNAGDVSIPDVRKLSRLLRIARARGTIFGRKPLWVTEVSYDSTPDPLGVPLRRHARWLAQTFYELWRQGVETVLWYQVADQGAGPGEYPQTSQSGVLFVDGRPKPAATAFAFPFVATRTRAWARSPSDGILRVQRRVGSTWQTVLARRVRRGAIANLPLRGAPGQRLRATVRGETSLTWTVE